MKVYELKMHEIWVTFKTWKQLLNAVELELDSSDLDGSKSYKLNLEVRKIEMSEEDFEGLAEFTGY